MPPLSDDLWSELQAAPAEPPQSCPVINEIQRRATLAGRTVTRARRDTEDKDADSALSDAEDFISDLDGPLEEVRDINDRLRKRCDALEEIAKQAIEALGRAEEEALKLNLENAVLEGARAFLVERVKRSWWRRLTDHAMAALWGRRARATARKNAGLRDALRHEIHRNGRLTDTLLDAEDFIQQLAWTGGVTEKSCIECGAGWRLEDRLQEPEHDINCAMGDMLTTIHEAIGGQA